MESKAKLVGHAIHPMLIVFPLGLLGMGAIFDLIHLGTHSPDLAMASYWMIAAGIIMGLLAAVFGFWDWAHLPNGSRAKVIGAWHGGGNVVIVGLFAVAWVLRLNARTGPVEYAPDGLPLILEVVGLVLALVTGWLGGELVERLGVGVDPGANVDAPNSLSGRPASEGPRGETHVPAASARLG